MREVIINLSKYLNFILIIIMGINCDPDVSEPTSDWNLYTFSMGLINYDVNKDPIFWVRMNPAISDSSQDIYRLYFVFEDQQGNPIDTSDYRFIQRGQDLKYEFGGGEFDFGGQLSKTVQINTFLERYDVNTGFPNPAAVKIGAKSKLERSLIITNYDPQDPINNVKWINLEIDQQNGTDLINTWVKKNIKAAFNACDVRFNYYPDELNLDNETILNDELGDYIQLHKQNHNWFYVCSVKGIEDIEGFWTLGRTHFGENISRIGSVIDHTDIWNLPKPYPEAYPDDNFYPKIFSLIIVHEFGHQFGLPKSSHDSGHSVGGEFCAMYSNIYYQGVTNWGYSRYENPHFCPNHVNSIVSLSANY